MSTIKPPLTRQEMMPVNRAIVVVALFDVFPHLDVGGFFLGQDDALVLVSHHSTMTSTASPILTLMLPFSSRNS